MRIIFMGTPEAAVPTLRRCLDDGHDVVAVWTQPDRPAGRGNKISSPPVKEFALSRGLTVHQPAKIRTQEAQALFASHQADLAVVVAYGRILPPSLLSAPAKGCINVHFSLLPKYRGAAPVNWAIVRGESLTGVTTMQMDEGLDTGPILQQRETKVGASETAPELMRRLALMGADLLGETLAHLDQIEPRRQREEDATFAPALRREDGLINWSRDAFEIERCVRGFQPWPNAYTRYQSQRLIIWRAQAARADQSSGEEGLIVEARGDHLAAVCGDQTVLRLLEVQPEGKRRMSARDFLNGAHVRAGERFG
ncbi:MAG TPA: methionyl-tRNA formyltransferase [Pyrinomonadaceae bacterium]|nr:methionyl-tRNA formyltransferase [Pyrinomonadaceae bacterium]